MSNLILTVVFLILCIAACVALAFVIGKKRRPLFKVLLSAALFIVTAAALFFVYVGNYYHATGSARSYLNGSEHVEVTKTSYGYFFDGVSDDTAIVFYPGAKVEAESYAPLMFRLAQNGYDCFLVKMPFNIALFGVGRASEILKDYDYENCYLMGHSLGGVCAASFASSHPEDVDGLILLASYPNSKLPDGIRLLSVTGSNDGCLNKDAYTGAKKNCPPDTEFFEIEGANHAQFGDYGKQQGDNDASVSGDDQQNRLAEKIVQWISNR